MSKIKTETDMRSATIADLVKWYNTKADKPIKKFATKGKAITRCIQLLNAQTKAKRSTKKGYIEGTCPNCDAKGKSQYATTDEHHECKKCHCQYYPDTGRIYSIDGMSVRSAAIKKSWKEGGSYARETRAQRHNVKVGQTMYRSVRQAFVELDLPLGEHIRFRMELKKVGALKRYGKNWTAILA